MVNVNAFLFLLLFVMYFYHCYCVAGDIVVDTVTIGLLILLLYCSYSYCYWYCCHCHYHYNCNCRIRSVVIALAIDCIATANTSMIVIVDAIVLSMVCWYSCYFSELMIIVHAPTDTWHISCFRELLLPVTWVQGWLFQEIPAHCSLMECKPCHVFPSFHCQCYKLNAYHVSTNQLRCNFDVYFCNFRQAFYTNH